MPPYTGSFEAHITIEPLQNEEKTSFIQFCEANHAKPIQIELARGDVALQQMTASKHEGDFDNVLTEVQSLAEQLRRQGFVVSRVKIEAAPFNQGLPADCAEVGQHSAENYFEHHLKLSLPTDGAGKDDILLQICEQHQAHLSRNAFKQHTDGTSERFVTARHYGLGKSETMNALAVLKETLIKNGFQILKTITEYCVYDDHVALDANWLTLENQSPCEACESDCIFSPV